MLPLLLGWHPPGFAIALAVAAVPEGLPVVTTLALARGMWRMARRNAVIEDLPAVETLGATTVICTDKTGTLTENRMQVARIADAAGVVEVGHLASGFTASPGLEAILDCGALCNGAELEGGDGGGGLGDPMEVALLLAARKAGIERAALLERLPEIRREPFDSAVKMMATYHRDSSQILIAVKGAPETVVVRARDTLTEDGAEILDEAARRAWLARAEELAGEGLRVLALAHRRVETPEAEPFQNLTLLGLVGLLDPAREGVAEAIGRCHDAGIRVVMVTGDHGVTARAIAADVGLCNADAPWRSGAALDVEPIDVGDCDVFARVSPEQKLRLVEYFQRQGDVVAMTGDGVNDAPALKKAEIGVAMGLRGTQVAREAAEMVLRDDAFATIVLAVEQGRVIFANIRKFVFYLLSCNTSEILVIGLATVAGMPLPLLPLQILFLNLLTDVFPALALGAGEGEDDVMSQPPRPPDEPVLTRAHWIAIVGYGLLITAVTLAALWVALEVLGLDARAAVTLSFLTLALAQLWHVFNMRERGEGLLHSDVTRNGYVWGALVLCLGLIVAALYVAPIAAVLQLVPPDATGWAVVLGFSLVPLVVGQIIAALRRG